MSMIRRIFATRFWVCAFFLAPVVAYAQSTPYFSGTVRDSSNQPLAGVAVEAGHVDFPIWSNFTVDGQAVTNAQGQYAITTLDAGDGSGNYVLIAQVVGYITEVYPDTPCYYLQRCPGYFPHVVAAPDTTADFQLFRPASISGHITRSDTNAPVCCVNVQLARNNLISFDVTSDAAGNYEVLGVLPGSYAAIASAVPDLLLPQSYAGHDYDSTMSAYGESDNFVLADGQNLQGIDFNLHPGGVFSGMITSAIDGAAIATDVSVRRHTPFDSGSSLLFASRSANYGEQNPGSYTSNAFVPGNFIVFFGRGYLFMPQYFAGAAFEANAQEVVLTSGQVVTGIDAQLTTMQSIAGKITDANTGLPLQGVTVHAGEVFIFALQDYVDTVTDASGNYLLQGLGATGPSMPPTSNYYIWVGGSRGHVAEFYTGVIDACCTYPPQGATTLALAVSQQLTGIDFSLPAAAYATGRIYDPLTNADVAGLYVKLYDAAGNPAGPTDIFFHPDNPSDASGNYVSVSVPTGSYYLALSSALGTILYPNVICPSSGCDFSQAQLLNFSNAQEYQNLDFAIPHLELIFRNGFDQ